MELVYEEDHVECLLLPDNLGLPRLSRFELTRLTGILVLYNSERGIRKTCEEAEVEIMQGEAPLYLQRNYSDGSRAQFKVLRGGLLELVSRRDEKTNKH